MKLKALLLACAVAGAGASFAFADDGHGKNHEHHGTTTTATTGTTTTAVTTTGMTTTTMTTTTPSNCVRMDLRGTLASVSATSFTLTVKRAGGDDDEDNNNGAAQALVGQTVTIAVDANTRVEWRGTGTLTGPNVGDSAKVKANSCGTPATLTALRVKAEGPRAANNGEHGDSHNSSKSHK